MWYVKISVVIIISLILFSGITISENENKNDNWAQVGHDARHTYKSTIKVNENNVGVLWKKSIPRGFESSDILLYKGLLFVVGEDNLSAINPQNGKLLWSKNFYSCSNIDSIGAGYDSIYILCLHADLSEGGSLYALDLNGNLKWNISFNATRWMWHITVGDDKTIYCIKSNIFTNSNLYAISLNGSIKWKKQFEDIIRPLVSVYNNRVYLTANTKLYVLNASTGKTIWVCDFSKDDIES